MRIKKPGLDGMYVTSKRVSGLILARSDLNAFNHTLLSLDK